MKSPAAAEMPAGIEGREYILWGLQYDPHVERYHMLTDAFEEETGAVAIVEPQAWPLETKVISAMAAGTVPDVTCIMGKQLVPLLEQEALITMEEAVFEPAGIDPDGVLQPGRDRRLLLQRKPLGHPGRGQQRRPGGRRAHRLGRRGRGRCHGHLEPGAGTGLVRQLRIGMAAGRNAAADGRRRQCYGLGHERPGLGQPNLDGHHARSWATLWDPDNQEFFLDSEEAMEALRLYVDVPIFERGIETHLDMHHMNALLAGRVAIGVGNNAMAGEAAKIDVPVESVARPPTTPGQDPLFVGEGGWGFEVPKQAENQEIGIKFLQFMCTYDAQYIFAGIYGGTMPAAAEVMHSDIYQGDDPVKSSVRRDVMVLPNTVYYGWGFGIPSEMERITSTAITQVRTGELGIAEACDQMQAEMIQHHAQWLKPSHERRLNDGQR